MLSLGEIIIEIQNVCRTKSLHIKGLKLKSILCFIEVVCNMLQKKLRTITSFYKYYALKILKRLTIFSENMC